MARILAFSSPATGHVLPIAPGLRALADRGHDVLLVADDRSIELVGELRLPSVALDPRIVAIPVDDHLAERDLDRMSRGLTRLMERGEFEREQLRDLIAEHRPDALIVDANAYGASTFAATTGLPWAISFPSLVPFPERGLPPYGLGLRPMGGPLGRVRDALLLRLVLRTFGKAMLPGLNRLRSEVDLPPLAGALDHFATADRLLALTGAPLEYPRVDPPSFVRFVGTEPWDPAATAPAWLAEPGHPWVLVTCSTDYQGDERLAAAAIEALRDEPVRVLVTLADASPDGLPTAPNARVERFVPHSAVLPHASVVVTHGGMGITQKTLCAGVPLVVVPFGRDQPEVARRVSECGAGVMLPAKRLTPERLRHAVGEAAARRPGAEAAGRRLRAAGGAEAFANAVEELVPIPVRTPAGPAVLA